MISKTELDKLEICIRNIINEHVDDSRLSKDLFRLFAQMEIYIKNTEQKDLHNANEITNHNFHSEIAKLENLLNSNQIKSSSKKDRAEDIMINNLCA
jgi:hypothetical protein